MILHYGPSEKYAGGYKVILDREGGEVLLAAGLELASVIPADYTGVELLEKTLSDRLADDITEDVTFQGPGESMVQLEVMLGRYEELTRHLPAIAGTDQALSASFEAMVRGMQQERIQRGAAAKQLADLLTQARQEQQRHDIAEGFSRLLGQSQEGESARDN